MLCLNPVTPTFQNMESWRISAFSQLKPIQNNQGFHRTLRHTTQTTTTNGLVIRCLNSLQTKTELMRSANVCVTVSTKSCPTLTRLKQEDSKNVDSSRWITASLLQTPPNHKQASAQLLKALKRAIKSQGLQVTFVKGEILPRSIYKILTRDNKSENKTSSVSSLTTDSNALMKSKELWPATRTMRLQLRRKLKTIWTEIQMTKETKKRTRTLLEPCL